MEKVVSCFISKAILDYVKLHCDQEYPLLFKELDPEIDHLPDPEAFLRDPHQWISSEVCRKLFERARLILKDEMAAFNIGKFGVENLAFGYAQKIVLKAVWSYNRTVKNAQKFHDRWGKTKHFELVELNKTDSIVRLHWHDHLSLSKDYCLINKGFYSYLPSIWGAKSVMLQEKCCHFEGAPYCEYHLKWSARNRLHEIRSWIFAPRSVLMETIKEMEDDKKIIKQKYDEVNRLNAELRNKIQQLLAIQETGKAILAELDLSQLLKLIMNLLSSVCHIKRAVILLASEEERALSYLCGIGFDQKITEQIAHFKLSLPGSNHLIAQVVGSGQSVYIGDLKHLALHPDDILNALGENDPVYIVPLANGTKVIGVLAAGSGNGRETSHAIRETLEIFTPQIAIAIENARLYGKLRSQMEELSRSYELLNRAEKFSFLGNIAARLAHEIKNPLTSIATFLQMLPQKYEDEEFRNNFHAIALEESNRVNNLITELLDLVKARESHFDLCSLNNLIEKMALLISPQSHAKRIDLSLSLDPEIGMVWMDAEKMKQIILNLLCNAVDFTPENGKIEITTQLEKSSSNDRMVSIFVKDNGVGIPSANLKKIFDPYFTTKYKSDLHNGTGLGLFIAHQNMQAHGGSIEVQSAVNEGTNFILYLPADPPAGGKEKKRTF